MSRKPESPFAVASLNGFGLCARMNGPSSVVVDPAGLGAEVQKPPRLVRT